ncbi:MULTISPECIES: class I SAM-dependent methyltransferase [unclassified Haematobacter]|uniref:class I SAM-dependent methyltransferase n=1 Tax=unclassified Haematobacter TaxID=2640585 RepID=UPI0025BD2BDF|nr:MULTISPECIES: class I SAM-dependent methyltransferase [unclassified Haematobacter]
MFELDTDHAAARTDGTLRRTSADTLSVLTSAFVDHGVRSVLDIGCGDGTLAAALDGRGFDVTGIDPSADALERARQRLPRSEFHCAPAEALPGSMGRFDAACFVNSLHHVSPDRMQDALMGAISTIRSKGILLVIEPLAQGSFFRAMRPIEDETRIRAQAASAVETLISDDKVILRDLRRWNRENHFTGLSDFIGYLARVLPERAEIARRNEAALARAWRDNIHSVGGMAVLIQPMVCWTLTANPVSQR